jgi:hypothetical protein
MALTRRGWWLALLLSAVSHPGSAGERITKPNVVASGVRGIPAGSSAVARVLAIVVDHEGQPLQRIPVTVTRRDGASAATGTTDADGRVILQVPVVGQVTVRASHVGFVPAEARLVDVRASSLAAVALPLEVAQVNDPITSERR